MSQMLEAGIRDADGEVAPTSLRIAHDDYHASLVGTSSEGQQFFITTPFTWAVGDQSSEEFAARYLFDVEGTLIDATIVALGARPGAGSMPGNVAQFESQQDAVAGLLKAIEPVTLGDITIAPFSVTSHGHEFGLVLRGPEDDEDDEWYWCVTVEPGDYMAFASRWDDGNYDT